MTTDLALLKSSVLVPSGAEEMAAFKKALNKLNVKAVKFGLPPVTAGEPIRERFVRRYDNDDDGYVKQMSVAPLSGDHELRENDEILYLNRIPLDYPIIALGQWKVLGKMEPLGEGRITFAATQSESELEVLAEYRQSEPCCEHCNTKRRRKETYVVRHLESGETKQIGSSCLEDFTGIDPAKVLFLAQMYATLRAWDDESEHFLGGVAGDHAVRPLDYLRDVMFVTEWQGGFVSSKRAKEEFLNPTYRLAKELSEEMRGQRALIERYGASRERLLASAQRVIDWWLRFEPTSEFERTAQQVVTAESIPCENKFLALAAASISAMDRVVAKTMAQEARAAHPSQHVGAAGQKMQQAMRVTGHFSFSSDFGTQYYVNFLDADGNKYSWKTSNPPREFGEADAKTKWFEGKFTVKDHGEFREEKVTSILRVKFDGWIPAPTLQESVEAVVVSPAVDAKPLLVVDVPSITQSFEDMGWRQQADLLLREVSDQLLNPRHDVLSPITLQDANGNEVGSVAYPTIRPEAPADGHLQIVIDPATRDAWIDALRESARCMLDLVAMSEGKIITLRDGRYREVGSVHWDALLEREDAMEAASPMGDGQEAVMP